MGRPSAAVKADASLAPSATKDRSKPTITVSMASNACRAAAPVMSAHPSVAASKHARKIAIVVQRSPAAHLGTAPKATAFARRE